MKSGELKLGYYTSAAVSFVLPVLVAIGLSFLVYFKANSTGRNGWKWVAIFLGAVLILPFAIGALGYLLGLGVLGYLFFAAAPENRQKPTNKPTELGWAEKFPQAKYKFYKKGYGIAIDLEGETLHLKELAREMSYPFSSVRDWKSNIATGGMVLGGGAFGAGQRIRQGIENKRDTGLFISVKDIENPKWRIEFPGSARELENELARWMEILNQSINKDV